VVDLASFTGSIRVCLVVIHSDTYRTVPVCVYAGLPTSLDGVYCRHVRATLYARNMQDTPQDRLDTNSLASASILVHSD